jgi:hypothetical protein
VIVLQRKVADFAVRVETEILDPLDLNLFVARWNSENSRYVLALKNEGESDLVAFHESRKLTRIFVFRSLKTGEKGLNEFLPDGVLPAYRLRQRDNCDLHIVSKKSHDPVSIKAFPSVEIVLENYIESHSWALQFKGNLTAISVARTQD